MRYITIALFCLFLVSGCSESALNLETADDFRPSVSQSEDLFFAKGGESESKVEVCHVDGKGILRRLEIATTSVTAHLAHGDVLSVPPQALSTAGATFSARNTYGDDGPDLAFDGDSGTHWNSGSLPSQWIEIVFPTPQTFYAMTVLVSQSLPGNTFHIVQFNTGAGPGWNGMTQDSDLLTYSFPSGQTAQSIRITTLSGPSPVAWREIQFLTRSC